jgi:hypothetical protein
MQQPHVGERVLIEDHPEVPAWWRGAWGRVVTDDGQGHIVVTDVMGRTVELNADCVACWDERTTSCCVQPAPR